MSRLGDLVPSLGHRSKSASPSRDLPRTVFLTILSICLAVVLAEIYSGFEALGWGDWQGALVFHAVLGLALVLRFYWYGVLSLKFALWGIAEKAPTWFARRPWLAYSPALILVGGAALLATISLCFDAPNQRGVISTPLAWIWLVPWAEELCFRGGIGGFYRRMLPGLGGVWLSAATFALAHADMTTQHLLHGRVGLPLGPFLLGLLCESVYLLSGSLLPAIAVHAAANATVIIFEKFDPRWLEWLGLLYV